MESDLVFSSLAENEAAVDGFKAHATGTDRPELAVVCLYLLVDLRRGFEAPEQLAYITEQLKSLASHPGSAGCLGTNEITNPC